MYWLVFILIISITIFLVWASADIGSNIYIKSICKADREDKVVSLTFDDGPDKTITPLVLDILKEYDIKATFFLIGKKAEKYPYLVKRIIAEGHIIANHTYSHSGFFPLSTKENVKEEIKDCNVVIKNAIGKKSKLFRPPFGVTNPIIAKVIKEKELKTIGWSIRSLDTMKKKRDCVTKKVISKLHPGAIILLHDSCRDADVLLKQLISSILEHGYKILPLDEMLNIDVYEN